VVNYSCRLHAARQLHPKRLSHCVEDRLSIDRESKTLSVRKNNVKDSTNSDFLKATNKTAQPFNDC
jgi:hypothetical protein